MAFVFKVSKEAIAGKECAPAGLYDLRLTGFKPKKTKDGNGVNYNPVLEIANHPDYDGYRVFENLSTNAAFNHEAFCKCFGLHLETDGVNYWLPGVFDADANKFNADDPETWVYVGPLLGKVGKAEVIIDSYNNKNSNKVGKNGYLPAPGL